MLTRRLTITPRPGTAHPSGATVHTLQGGGQIAVLRCETSEQVTRAWHALKVAGFVGSLLPLLPGQEFTLCEEDDGAPARWNEDGLPSYSDLALKNAAQQFALEHIGARVKELEAREAARGDGAAACGPAFRVMP